MFFRDKHEKVIQKFNQIYYDSEVWKKTTWLGVPTQKCPMDLWIYQEIMFEVKPDLVIETGTADGGSALFLASLCDLLGKGRVVSVDIQAGNRPRHPRVTYLQGSSVAPEILEKVRSMALGCQGVFVILDSDHSKAHVLKEMEAYGEWVTPNSYLVIEDSNINGHPVLPRFGEGPWEAIEEYFRRPRDFETDTSKEKFMATFNPRGYLKKVR